jgi:hypothetical protein
MRIISISDDFTLIRMSYFHFFIDEILNNGEVFNGLFSRIIQVSVPV